MRNFFTTIICLVLVLCASAQSQDFAFQSGEELSYVVSYRAKLIPNIDAGRVDLTLVDTLYFEKKSLKISARATVLPFFRWFFDLDDRYDTWTDPQSLRPMQANCDLREGNYRFRSRVSFDWNENKAHSTYRNLKHAKDKHKILSLENESYDILSLFYNLRSKNIEDFRVAETMHLSLVLEDTVRKVDYKFLGSEQIRIKGQGKFNALKFSCTLVTSSGESFEDGTELFVWISDDKNHIPLLVESPVRVGSVRARLKEFSNLKHPITSKIK